MVDTVVNDTNAMLLWMQTYDDDEDDDDDIDDIA